jgi:hypothetical protein
MCSVIYQQCLFCWFQVHCHEFCECYQHVSCSTYNRIVTLTILTFYNMLFNPFYNTNPLCSSFSFCPSFFVWYLHLHFTSYKNLPNFLSPVILLSLISFFWILAEGLFLLHLLLALQSLVKLSLFQNCPPLFSVLLLTSPFPHPKFFRPSSIDWNHLNSGFTSSAFVLRPVTFLQLSISCILKSCPSHVSLPIFTTLLQKGYCT